MTFRDHFGPFSTWSSNLQIWHRAEGLIIGWQNRESPKQPKYRNFDCSSTARTSAFTGSDWVEENAGIYDMFCTQFDILLTLAFDTKTDCKCQCFFLQKWCKRRGFGSKTSTLNWPVAHVIYIHRLSSTYFPWTLTKTHDPGKGWDGPCLGAGKYVIKVSMA